MTIFSSWPFLIAAFILSWLYSPPGWHLMLLSCLLDWLSSVLDWSLSWPPSFCDWLSLLAWSPSWLSFFFLVSSHPFDSYQAVKMCHDYPSRGFCSDSAQFSKCNNSIQSSHFWHRLSLVIYWLLPCHGQFILEPLFLLPDVMSQYVENSWFSIPLATVTSPSCINWFPNTL